MALTVCAAVSLCIWLYLCFLRGGFWRVSQTLTHSRSAPLQSPIVGAVIPARNEAETIGKTIGSLLEQNYQPSLHIVLVDDGSSDTTAEVARQAAAARDASHRLTILNGKPLPAGWTGKLWALSQGVDQARALQPEFLLLTDADILHGADSLGSLVSLAEDEQCDLVSYMVKLACQSRAEKLLIPAFVYFFLQLYPPSWIQSTKRKTAGAAGGCVLIRSRALDGIGGLAVIRDAVIDDCALARAIKRNGGRIRLALTAETASLRSYGSYREIGQMISRTAFYQLKHSTWLLLATLLGLLITYVVPIIALCSRQQAATILGGLAWLLLVASYWPMVRFYRLSAGWVLTLPVAALFYSGTTLHSAVRYWSGKGGQWKERVQDARVRRVKSD